MQKEYELTKADFEQLERLLKNVKVIDRLYHKLYQLEITGQKESAEYQQTLANLDIALEIEANIAKEIIKSESSAIATIEHLRDTIINIDKESDIEPIILQKNNDRVIKRVIYLLYALLLKFYNIIRPVEINFEINTIFQQEVLTIFLRILEEHINNKEYSDIRDALLSVKYEVSFINKDIEEQLRLNKFNPEESLFFDSRLGLAFLKLDCPKDYEILKDAAGVKLSVPQITKILQLSDLDYNNPANRITVVLRQTYIRAAFLLLNDQSLSEINYNFHHFIEGSDYLSKHQQDKIAIELVAKTFLKTKGDKENLAGIMTAHKNPKDK